jgi:hypothetical protein
MTDFLSGTYTVKYGGTTIGQTKDVAIEYVPRKQLITGDNHADTPQDAVNQGLDCFVDFTCIDWDTANTETLFWPYATWGAQGTVGRIDIQDSGPIAQAILLTNAGGNPAAGTPTTIALAECVLAEGFQVATLFAPELRQIPMRLRVYPVSGVYFVPTYA